MRRAVGAVLRKELRLELRTLESVPGMALSVPGNMAGAQPLCQVFNAEPTGQCGNVQVYVPDNGLFYCVLGQ